MYPPVLALKLTSSNTVHANYLDMDIHIDKNNRNMIHGLFDKRNDFSFKVISMPNLSSNIPIKPTYGVFYSQLVRLFNANNDISKFKIDIKFLMDKLSKQNFVYVNLKHEMHEFNNKCYYHIVSLKVNTFCYNKKGS